MAEIKAKKVIFKNRDGEYLLPMTEDKTGLVLFDTILKDHILTYEESKGLALQGTYVYKTAIVGERYGYPDFYAKCLEEYENAEYLPWTQPKATGATTAIDGGNMVITCSSAYSGYDAYKAMDGTLSGTTPATGWGTDNTTAVQWWQVKFPYKIRITGLTGYQRYDIEPNNANTIGRFYTSSDKTTPIGDEYNNAIGINWNAVSVTGISAEGVITDTIYFEKTGGGGWGGFGELKIEATYPYFKINTNGHKFYDIANKAYIDSIYNTTGIADYYGIDLVNERIFLPRNDYFVQLTTDTNKVNETIEAGLPNITGTIKGGGAGADWMSGAFTYLNSDENGNSGRHDGGADRNYNSGTAQFSASSSNSIYGKSKTVQPPSSLKLLYYCVGNTVSDISWVDVVTQVEGGVKDLEDKTNEGIEALANASNALRTTQITNCITEIPQRIKLELNNGTLTLKAGSEVTVPNGFEADGTTPKFDYVTIESDQSLTKGTGTEQVMFFARNTTGTLMRYTISQIYSGSSAPTVTTQYARWYDTSTNKIKDTSDTGITWSESYTSFPLGIGSTTTSSITELTQTFNGMGYIGSTVWVDKGVKGLIPNGRNADGTLNNIEYTKNKISIATFTGGYADTFWLRLSPTGTLPNHGILTRYNIRSFSNAPTPAVGKWYSVYVEDENMFYYSSNGGAYFKDSAVDLGVYSSSADNKITSLKPKQPFRAINYSDKSEISGWGMPSGKYIDLTLGASGSTYTAPANGWLQCACTGTVGSTFFELVADHISSTASFTGGWGRTSIPVKKGDAIVVYYGGNNFTKRVFRFTYAEGEK